MVDIPTILVLIVCKTTAMAPGSFDADNAKFTQFEGREWATEHSMMVCRRHEIQMYDPVETQIDPKDKPVPMTPNFANAGQCARAGVRLAIGWDQEHRNTPWRVWKVGCPTPIVDTRTGQIIGYKLPECGHRDTVVCETDSVI